jgi:hypothetical protein
LRAVLPLVLVCGIFFGVLFGGGQLLGVWNFEPAASSARESGARTYRFTKADQAAARRIVLTKRNMGRGWNGGPKNPDLSPSEKCADFRPKESDLVTTGLAESEFRHLGGAWVHTRVEVMQTPRMVRLEWKRNFEHPNVLRCLRRIAARSNREAGHRFVSLRAMPFPNLAPYVKRYRSVQTVRRNGRSIPTLVDVVFLGVGRYELALSLAAPLASRRAADQAEVRVARILLTRARA